MKQITFVSYIFSLWLFLSIFVVMILLVSVLVVLVVCFLIGRAVLWMVGYKPTVQESKPVHTNPYIIAHLGQLANDRHYDEYIAYLDKNNIEGIPFDKEITSEEARMKKELDLN